MDTILSNAVIKVKSDAGFPPTSINDATGVSSQIDPVVSSFFKLNEFELTNDQKEQLAEIANWIKSKAGDEPLDYVNVLRDIRFRLGAPRVGESDLKQIHQYVKLRSAASSLLDQAKAMEQ